MLKWRFCWNFTSDIIMMIIMIISTLVKITIVAVVIITNVLMHSPVPSAIFHNNHFTSTLIWNLGPLDRFLKMVLCKPSEFNRIKQSKMKWSEGASSSFQSPREHKWNLILPPFLTFPALAFPHSPGFDWIVSSHFSTPLLIHSTSLLRSSHLTVFLCVLGLILCGLFSIAKCFSGRDAL